MEANMTHPTTDAPVHRRKIRFSPRALTGGVRSSTYVERRRPVESRYRLMPGAMVELYLRREKQPATVVRGRIVRCHVVRLGADTVCYHGAIAFERYLWTL